VASQFLKDFASSVMLGTTPGVKRPSVNRPSPFDNDGRMDISDRFRPVQDYSNSSSGAYQQSYSQGSTERTDSYGGPLDVSGMTQSVANQFVGMDPTLGSTLSMTGINPFMALGAGLSKKNLENIESKIAEGTSGYALGMLNGRIVGVSPSLFGGYNLSGVLPTGLSTEQRNQLINNLLASREMIDNPKDFAVSPQPSIQPSDEERAISYKQNVVTDSSDNPVTSGESYVTTRQGQYVNQQELEAQLEATRREADRQAAEEARQAEEAAQQARENSFSGENRPDNSRGSSRESPYGRGGGPGYGGGRAAGGTVGFAEGGTAKKDPIQSTGFVDGPPQAYAKGTTVADTENHRVRVGSFVINAPTTERLQKEGKLPKGPQKMKAAKGGKMMEVALSKGEYVVDVSDIDKFGGYDALNKENDKGKPEVDRRQAMQEGGFVTPPERSPVRQQIALERKSDVGENVPQDDNIRLEKSTLKKFKAFLGSPKRREDVERLVDNMDDRERLAVLALVETTAAEDSIESMMGVGQTAINRAKSNRKDFVKVNDLPSVLKQRSGRGSGSKMFQYDGLEPGNLEDRLTEVVKGQVPGAISKIFSAADNLLNPETESDPILPFDITSYTTPGAPLAKDMELNPSYRYFTSFGGHDFYAYDAAPESLDEKKIFERYKANKKKKKKK